MTMKTLLKSLIRTKKAVKEEKLVKNNIFICIYKVKHKDLVFYHQLWSQLAFRFREEGEYLRQMQFLTINW